MDKGGGEEGEDEMNGESNMETYTLQYVKQISSRNLLYGSGDSNWGSETTWRGGEMVGSGSGAQEGEDICTPMANSC